MSIKADLKKTNIIDVLNKDTAENVANALAFGYMTNEVMTSNIKELFEVIDSAKSEELIEKSLNVLNEIARRLSIGKVRVHYELASGNANSALFDFITSNLLARSNVNSNAMRIGIANYLFEHKSLLKAERQRILGRFGRTLLNHVFQNYFSFDAKESKKAFDFLKKHLYEFLGGSAVLADLTNAVLQLQMRTHKDKFFEFLKTYIHSEWNSIRKDSAFARSFTIHLAFLTQKTCDMDDKKLIHPMFEILVKHLDSFSNTKYYQIANDIISKSGSPVSRQLMQTLSERNRPKAMAA
jgi:hypothetical protein